MPPCLELIEAAAARARGPGFRFETLAGGAGHYRETGQSMPARDARDCARADAILLCARWGCRTCATRTGARSRRSSSCASSTGSMPASGRCGRSPASGRSSPTRGRARSTIVIVRESTEGLFAPQAPGEIIDDREARETLVLTRPTCEKLYDFCFRLAARARGSGRRGSRAKVTHVDKANVFRAFHWARGIFHERARGFPEIAADAAYVDAFAMHMVQKPWTIDVAVTENMFGDILSDLGAALMGGLGYAPSADIGDEHAVFQPCHGTAPDIAGKGLANPTAMFLSGAMMLEWLGARHGTPEAARTAALLRRAVDAAFADGRLVTCRAGRQRRHGRRSMPPCAAPCRGSRFERRKDRDAEASVRIRCSALSPTISPGRRTSPTCWRGRACAPCWRWAGPPSRRPGARSRGGRRRAEVAHGARRRGRRRQPSPPGRWLAAAGAEQCYFKYCSTFELDSAGQYRAGRAGADGGDGRRLHRLLPGLPGGRAHDLPGPPLRLRQAAERDRRSRTIR